MRLWPLLRQGGALTAGLLAAITLAGAVAGLSAAAGGLALAGRTLFDFEVAPIQVFLVVGPLAGLLPVAALGRWAARSTRAARHAPWALLAWLLGALAALYWYGIQPLLG